MPQDPKPRIAFDVKKSSIGGKQYLDYLSEPWWLSCYIEVVLASAGG